MKFNFGGHANKIDLTLMSLHGVAELRGKSIRDRSRALIAIANPEFRDYLTKQASEAGIIYPDRVILSDY